VDNFIQKVLYNAYLGYIFYYLVTLAKILPTLYKVYILQHNVGKLGKQCCFIETVEKLADSGKKKGGGNNFLSIYANSNLQNQKIILDSMGHKLEMDLIHKFHWL